jgi:hypothetical protein
MCSATLECGYAARRHLSPRWHSQQERDWFVAHPQIFEEGLVSIKDWHVGGNYFRRLDEPWDEYIARKRKSGWIPREEALPLAREYGRKLKKRAPDRRVFIRMNYWCSGTEITVLEEIDNDGSIIAIPDPDPGR